MSGRIASTLPLALPAVPSAGACGSLVGGLSSLQAALMLASGRAAAAAVVVVGATGDQTGQPEEQAAAPVSGERRMSVDTVPPWVLGSDHVRRGRTRVGSVLRHMFVVKSRTQKVAEMQQRFVMCRYLTAIPRGTAQFSHVGLRDGQRGGRAARRTWLHCRHCGPPTSAACLGVLLRAGTATRAEIARETGLATGTVSSIVRELAAAEILVHRGRLGSTRDHGHAGEGSRARRRAVDLGHSHVAVALGDMAWSRCSAS